MRGALRNESDQQPNRRGKHQRGKRAAQGQSAMLHRLITEIAVPTRYPPILPWAAVAVVSPSQLMLTVSPSISPKVVAERGRLIAFLQRAAAASFANIHPSPSSQKAEDDKSNR